MNPDPASLDNLRPIVQPPPVPWWPPAPGWWLVVAVLTLVAVAATLRAWRVWRANVYRRAALKELRSATCVAEIAEILKRVALCVYPRVDIAALTGSAWLARLEQTAGQRVPAPVCEALTRGVYADARDEDVADLLSFADLWIRSC